MVNWMWRKCVDLGRITSECSARFSSSMFQEKKLKVTTYTRSSSSKEWFELSLFP